MQTFEIDKLDQLNEADLQEFLNLLGLRFRQARDAVNLSREEFVSHFHFRDIFGTYSKYKIKDIESGDFGKRNARGEAIKFLTGMSCFFNVDSDIFLDTRIKETGFVQKIRKGMKNKYKKLISSGQKETDAYSADLRAEPMETCDESEIFADWGNAPEVGKFHGREKVLGLLEKWVFEDRCRIVSLLGMGGIGKTRLALKFCSKDLKDRNNSTLDTSDFIKKHFDFFLWRKLNDQPAPDDFFNEILLVLSRQKETALPETCRGKISRLLWYMRLYPCLIVLDNMESIMSTGGPVGEFLEGFDAYGDFFRQAGDVPHKSCILLTGREKPLVISMSEGPDRPVRSMILSGLDEENAKKVIMDAGMFSGSADEFKELARLYNGNPLALNLVARHIQDVFFGDIEMFLSSGTSVFCDIRQTLDRHFERMTTEEKEIMFRLAIHREPLTWRELQETCISRSSQNNLNSVIQWLIRRIAVEKTPQGFTLQPVLMAYFSDRLISECCHEIETGRVDLLYRVPVYEASASEQIRQNQYRLIVKPILDMLIEGIGLMETGKRFRKLLDAMRSGEINNEGYCGGNLFNLIPNDPVWENGFDFSHIVIREGEIKGKKMERIHLYGNRFHRCEFYQTLGTITSAAVSPTGNFLAFGDKDGWVYLFDPTDGRVMNRFRNPPGWIWAVVFSHDGKTIISSSGDQSIRFWNLEGENKGILKKGQGSIHDISIHPNGRFLASCESDEVIRLYDLLEMTFMEKVNIQMDHPICLKFSPDGKKLAIGGADGKLEIWDWEKQQSLFVIEAHEGYIWSIDWKHDGGMIASGGKDRMIRLWHPQNGQNMGILKGHEDFIRCLTFAPDGCLLASGSQDNTIKLWDTSSFSCAKTFHGHSGWVWTLSFTKKEPYLISTGHDKTLRIWDCNKGTCLKTLHGYDPVSPVVSFGKTTGTLFVGCPDSSIQIRRLEGNGTKNDEPKFVMEQNFPSGHTHMLTTLEVAPDNKKIVTGSIDNKLIIRDIDTETTISLSQGRDGWVWSANFSPDGKTIAFVSDNYTVRLINARDGSDIQTFIGHTNWVRTVVFDPNGRFLVSGGADQTLRFWDIQSGECIRVLEGHKGGILCAAISKNGKVLASGSGNGELKLWDIVSGVCYRDIHNHSGKIFSLKFDPESRLVFSGGSDNTLYIHDISEGTCLQALKIHSDSILSISVSEDGRFLASGSKDETIRVFDLVTLKPIQSIFFPKPYENMNIFHSQGLTKAQKASLLMLGAVEHEEKKELPIRC